MKSFGEGGEYSPNREDAEEVIDVGLWRGGVIIDIGCRGVRVRCRTLG